MVKLVDINGRKKEQKVNDLVSLMEFIEASSNDGCDVFVCVSHNKETGEISLQTSSDDAILNLGLLEAAKVFLTNRFQDCFEEDDEND